MAAVAQYYSDNLRTEVLKGMDEKVRQGWPTGGAPYGYMNVDDADEPVQPHPDRSRTVVRIFELYATGEHTFKTLSDQLARDGHVFRSSQPRFHRTALSYILNNRFYIGELRRNGSVFEGRYQRLIDRGLFEACQRILHGKNRRTGKPVLPLSGGLFRCSCCGQSITGERIRRRLRKGGVREHVYYRCANNDPGAEHPRIRWPAEDLEKAIIEDLAGLRLPSQEVADWFRDALSAAITQTDAHARHRATALKKRRPELAGMQDRLLNAYLAGTVDEVVYRAKADGLRSETGAVEESLERLEGQDPPARQWPLRCLISASGWPISGGVQTTPFGVKSSTRFV